MKNSFITLFTILVSCLSFAHPGIGIVKDSKGFIYYTDLKNVYRVNPHTMKEMIAVRSVHTHELYIDNNDNLFGEHLWYNGEQLNTWGHYVWRMNSNGRLDSVIKPTEGFLDNYSFNRDSSGNMYWVQRFTISRFKIKSVDGTIRTIAEGKFKDIRWMYVTKAGIIYFTDLTDLYKLDKKGKFTLLAKDLHERTSIFEYGSLKHNIFGIWTDKDENIYTAVTGGQLVKKITQNGKISHVAYSSGGWGPTGGVFDNQGNLWLLESKTGPGNPVRIRKIDAEKMEEKPAAGTYWFNKIRPMLIIGALAFLLLKLILLVVKKLRSKEMNFT